MGYIVDFDNDRFIKDAHKRQRKNSYKHKRIKRKIQKMSRKINRKK